MSYDGAQVSSLEETMAQDAAKLIQQAVVLGYTVTLGEAWRTAQQAALNAAVGTGIVHSLHIERLAIDLNFFKSGIWVTDGSELQDIGSWWEALGPQHYWGGRFGDGNHFSISPNGGATK